MKKISGNKNKWVCGIAYSLIFCALIIYVPLMFHNNLWLDEMYTILYLSGALTDVFNTTAYNDVHPPFYYLTLKVWSMFVSDSLISLRFFSLIPAILCIFLGVGPVRKLFDDKTAFLWTLCMLFSPFAFYMSLDIRMYSWSVFFVSGALVYSFMVQKYPTRINWQMLVLLSLCGVFSHYYCAFAIALIWMFLSLSMIIHYKTFYKIPKIYYLSAAAVFFAAICCLMIFYTQYTHQIDKSWIRLIDVKQAIVKNIFFAPECHFFSILTWFVFFATFIGIFFRIKNIQMVQIAIAALLVLILFIVGLSVSFLFKPLFVFRYFYPFTGCFFLVVSYGVSKIKFCYCTYLILFLGASIASYDNTYQRISDTAQAELIAKIKQIDKEALVLVDSSYTDLFYRIYSNQAKREYPTENLNLDKFLKSSPDSEIYLFFVNDVLSERHCYYSRYADLIYCLAKIKNNPNQE